MAFATQYQRFCRAISMLSHRNVIDIYFVLFLCGFTVLRRFVRAIDRFCKTAKSETNYAKVCVSMYSCTAFLYVSDTEMTFSPMTSRIRSMVFTLGMRTMNERCMRKNSGEGRKSSRVFMFIRLMMGFSSPSITIFTYSFTPST